MKVVMNNAADFASPHLTVSLGKFGVGAFFPNAGLVLGSTVCSLRNCAEPSMHTWDTIVLSITSWAPSPNLGFGRSQSFSNFLSVLSKKLQAFVFEQVHLNDGN